MFSERNERNSSRERASSDLKEQLDSSVWRTPPCGRRRSVSGTDRTDVAVASSCLTVPRLPLRPPPHQRAPLARPPFGLRRLRPPVGVAGRLSVCPLPASSALPVIQACEPEEETSWTFVTSRFLTEDSETRTDPKWPPPADVPQPVHVDFGDDARQSSIVSATRCT